MLSSGLGQGEGTEMEAEDKEQRAPSLAQGNLSVGTGFLGPALSPNQEKSRAFTKEDRN